MNKAKKISVIIPVYNNKSTIKKCINSVLKQSYKVFEIIIINDGSNDGTMQELQQFKKNKKIIIFNQSNMGVSVARNIGIKHSTGEYISFIDADDYVEEHFLQDLVDGMAAGIDMSVVGIRHVYLHNPKKKRSEIFYEGEFSTSKVLNFLLFKHGPQGYLCNKLWKKDIIIKNNIFLDPSINVLEDAIFTVNYLLNSKRINIKNKKDYIYVHGEKSLTSGMSFTKNNPDYFQTYKTMIKSASQIKKIIVEKGDKQNKKAASVFLGMVYTDYLRHLLVYGKLYKNKQCCVEYKKIRKKLFKLKPIILKYKYLDKKSCIIFLLTIYTPIVMKLIDCTKK